MKIGVIQHKVSENSQAADVLRKIEFAIKNGLNIIVAGDYALSNELDMLTPEERKEVIGRLERISSANPDTLILPGTMPWADYEKRLMFHSCPAFLGGKQNTEFYKETDHGEFELAKKHGLDYLRGDNKKNKLIFRDKKIAIEICSDHGKQILDKDTWLEIVMAHDSKAGFYVRDNSFDRYGILCDTYNPSTGCFRFNRGRGIRQISKDKIKEDLDIYKLR